MILGKTKFLFNTQFDELDYDNINEFNWTKDHVNMLVPFLKGNNVRFKAWESLSSNTWLVEYNNVFYNCSSAKEFISIFLDDILTIFNDQRRAYYKRG